MRLRAAAASRALLCVLALVATPTRAAEGARGDSLGLGRLLSPLLGANLEELVRAASESCDALPLDVLYLNTYVPDVELIEFQRDSLRSYSLSEGHLQLRGHLPTPVLIYIPGWWNTPGDDSTETMVAALLTDNPSVLVVDTRPIFSKGYVASAAGVRGLAHRLYKFIKNLHEDGCALSSIRLIGFSLGAHVAGVTGKLVQKHLHRKLERIVALDPARPCFSLRSRYRLDRSDAGFVQVVHTSAGVLGVEEPLGHADVYANGVLVTQPECENRSLALGCDHAQAWRLYAASVVDARALAARRCAGWDELGSGYCAGDEAALGYSCSPDTRGVYLYKSPVKKSRSQVRKLDPLDVFGWLLKR